MQYSGQSKIEQSRRPRVHIGYQVETGVGTVSKSLPFVVGVMGDYAGNAPVEPLKPLRSHKFVQIDRDNFSEVMSSIQPGLNLRVENKLSGQGDELSVQLRFRSMEDFEPGRLVEQVEPLRKLLELRSRLCDLRAKVDSSADLEHLLEQILQDIDCRERLRQELAVRE